MPPVDVKWLLYPDDEEDIEDYDSQKQSVDIIKLTAVNQKKDTHICPLN